MIDLKKVFLTLFILTSLFLTSSEPVSFRSALFSSAYYPKYKKYKFNEPLIGIKFDLEIYNMFEYFGVGGSANISLVSLHNKVAKYQTYKAYVHRFWNVREDKSFFLHGFYAGIKQTNISYDDYDTSLNHDIYMSRPALGYNVQSEVWGFNVCWTLNEEEKTKWEYEVIFRNNSGIVMLIGGSINGTIPGMKSEFFIYSGYEYMF